MSDCLQKVSDCLQKVSDGLGNLSDGLRKVSNGLVFLRPFKGNVDILKAYLVVFGQFLSKKKKKIKNTVRKSWKKNIIKKVEMWIRVGRGGGGQRFLILLKFYNII